MIAKRHSDPDPEALRQAALACLGSQFTSLSPQDRDDLAGDTYEAYLQRERAGEEIRDPVALIRQIATNKATDATSGTRSAVARATPIDPQSDALAELADEHSDPEGELFAKSERARAHAAVSALPAMLRAVYKARFVDELSAAEASKRLGMPRSTYFLRLNQVVKAAHDALEPKRFAWIQERAVRAYIAGARGKDYELGAKLVADDPSAAALARSLGRLHETLAFGLPALAISHSADPSLIERLGYLAAALRERLPGGGGAGEQSAATLAASGGTRGAGVASAGALAKLASLGIAGKVAIGCVGATAAATACIAAGVTPWEGTAQDKPPKDVTAPIEAEVEAPAPTVVVPPKPESDAETGGEKQDSTKGEEAEASPEEESSAPALSNAPAPEREFGVAAGANSRSTSSGSSGGGGGGGSAGQREFGS